jgi:hypothetical protein
MPYGIKISKDGVDVKTAANKDLVLTSDKNMFKVKQSGTVSYTFTGSETGDDLLATINHGLGYVPATMVFVYDPINDTHTHLSYFLSYSGGGTSLEWIYYEVDSADLKIYYAAEGMFVNDWSPNEFVFKYYIMYDEGQ